MKKAVIILLALLIVLIGILTYMAFNNKQLVHSNLLLEQEINKLLSEKNELIHNLDIIEKQNTELNEKQEFLEQQLEGIGEQQTDTELEPVGTEEEYYKKKQRLEEIINDLRDDISTKNDIISKLESRTMTYTFKIGEKIIEIGTPEATIDALLGEGVEISSWVENGDGFWYLKGAHQKKVRYKGIEVWYIKYEGQNEFKASMITVTDDTTKLANSLAVGDSIERLLQIYPSFIDDNDTGNDVFTYYYQDMESLMGLEIKVEKNKVAEIIVGEIFD